MKVLHLLRHAKSDWSDPSLPDHDRPLAGRGRRARRALARHVRTWEVDVVLASSALRAQATAAPVAAALGRPVLVVPSLYDASPAEVLDVVHGLPASAERALLVAHDPGLTELSAALTGVVVPYPTAALGTVVVDVATWAEVVAGSGRLAAYVTPAGLAACAPR